MNKKEMYRAFIYGSYITSSKNECKPNNVIKNKRKCTDLYRCILAVYD